MLDIIIGSSTCVKCKNDGTLTWLKSLTHRGLMYLTKYDGWFNKYVPGFMCVGCKPHSFCNERHNICCGLTSILWRSQILEGKYRPGPFGQK